MKNKILSLVALLLVISCALESKFGLPNNEEINRNLIGTWFGVEDSFDTLVIRANGKKTYKLLFADKTEAISYSATIKGFNILNLISEETKFKKGKTNSFYGFEIKNDTIEFYEVNNQLRKKDFNSQSALLDFFNENIDKPNFFINPMVLVKK